MDSKNCQNLIEKKLDYYFHCCILITRKKVRIKPISIHSGAAKCKMGRSTRKMQFHLNLGSIVATSSMPHTMIRQACMQAGTKQLCRAGLGLGGKKIKIQDICSNIVVNKVCRQISKASLNFEGEKEKKNTQPDLERWRQPRTLQIFGNLHFTNNQAF